MSVIYSVGKDVKKDVKIVKKSIKPKVDYGFLFLLVITFYFCYNEL